MDLGRFSIKLDDDLKKFPAASLIG